MGILNVASQSGQALCSPARMREAGSPMSMRSCRLSALLFFSLLSPDDIVWTGTSKNEFRLRVLNPTTVTVESRSEKAELLPLTFLHQYCRPPH